MKQPSEKAMHRAAQLWCEPEHASKEMDSALAMSIALALDAFAAEAVKAERRVLLGAVIEQKKLADKSSKNWRSLDRPGWHTARALAYEWVAAVIRARGKE